MITIYGASNTEELLFCFRLRTCVVRTQHMVRIPTPRVEGLPGEGESREGRQDRLVCHVYRSLRNSRSKYNENVILFLLNMRISITHIDRASTKSGRRGHSSIPLKTEGVLDAVSIYLGIRASRTPVSRQESPWVYSRRLARDIWGMGGLGGIFFFCVFSFAHLCFPILTKVTKNFCVKK